MRGYWSVQNLRLNRDGWPWPAIANILGSVILHAQAACNSPLRLSSSSQGQTVKRETVVSRAPRIASMQMAPVEEFVSDLEGALDIDY